MSTAIAAPSAAPDAVPRTYGSASGLRRMPWNVVPATASPSPTIIADRTRGSRRSMTIVSAAGVHVPPISSPSRRWARIATVSPGATATVPSPTARTSTTTQGDDAPGNERPGPRPGALEPARVGQRRAEDVGPGGHGGQ